MTTSSKLSEGASENRLVVSIVDYAAWRKGYLPPSEHVLIHELSYEGARVVMSSSGRVGGWWLVVRGGTLNRRQAISARRALEDYVSDEEAPRGREAVAADIFLEAESFPPSPPSKRPGVR